MEPQTQLKPKKVFDGMYVIRRIVAGVVIVAICVYISLVVLGRIPVQQKLGVADIGVIILAAGVASILLRPELLNRISHFKFGELELDWLQKIEADQKKQRVELDDVRFVLTLLLQQNELEHLKNLENGKTQYQGNEAVCAELRKLRLCRTAEASHVRLDSKSKRPRDERNRREAQFRFEGHCGTDRPRKAVSRAVCRIPGEEIIASGGLWFRRSVVTVPWRAITATALLLLLFSWRCGA